MQQIAARIDRFAAWCGRALSWLTLAMVAVIFIVVVLRYALDAGWIWLQESVTFMHGAVFMLAAAYTLAEDGHVRVDVFYRGMSARRRAWVDLAGTLVFLFPFCGFLFFSSLDFAALAWQMSESSREAGGLGHPWPALAKSFIPLAAVLLAVQGVAMLLRSVAVLRGAGASGGARGDAHGGDGL